MDRVWVVAIVGMGDVGRALANYNGFTNRGFHVELVFDNDPQRIGSKVGDFTVLDTADMSEQLNSTKKRMVFSFLKEYSRSRKDFAGDELHEDDWAIKTMDKLGFFRE